VSFSGEKRGGCGENIGGCGEKVENSGEKCKFAGEKKKYHYPGAIVFSSRDIGGHEKKKILFERDQSKGMLG
jgi:hypothetical protein